MDFALHDAADAGFGKAVVITRSELRSELSAHFDRFPSPLPVRYIDQRLDDLPGGAGPPTDRARPWGTAHALWAARSEVRKPFAVINADDFYGGSAYWVAATFLHGVDPTAARFAIVAYELGRSLSASGGVSRAICSIDEDSRLLSVTEVLDIVATGSGIRGRTVPGELVALSGLETVSMNFWAFTPGVFGAIERALSTFLPTAGADAELHLPTVVNDEVAAGAAVVQVLPSGSDTFGVTYEGDRDAVVARLAELVGAGEVSTTDQASNP